MSATDWGVNNDEHGDLTGYGWSETAGWVNFSPGTSRANIDAHGTFSGYVWSENLGWIALAGNISGGGTYGVATTWQIDETPPTIAALKQDGNQLINGDLLALRPEITVVVTDTESGVNAASLIVYLDGTAVTDGTASGGHYDSYDALTGLMTYAFKSDMTSGSHSLKIEAKDMAANTGELTLASLTVNAEFMIARGSEGGLAGFNKLNWDGRDSSGGLIPNGVYLYLISATSADGKTAGARGKLASQK